MGDSVTSIGSYAFEGCSSLTSVTISDSVTTIGSAAFWCCSSLTSVTIGDSVTTIGSGAFSDCSNLQFTEYGNCKYLGNGDNAYFALIETVNDNFSSYTIHESTKVIADYAFDDCARMGSIVIPDSVISIGSSAFQYCTNLTSVTIPDSVTTIGSGAFLNCSSLTSVTFTDTSDWYYTLHYDNFINKTGGTQIDVTNTATNASNLTSGYYWYKK